MYNQRVRRLLRQMNGACALATTAALMFTPSAMASPYTADAPDNAGSTTYETGNNHYTIYDTKGDGQAVAVIFELEDGTDVGFQSCHEGSGGDCPGDLSGSVEGKLFMATGVGLGAHKTGYAFGPRVKIPDA